jgi:acid phosphatase type 7
MSRAISLISTLRVRAKVSCLCLSFRPSQEYDYPAIQDGSKDPSGAGRMWSPPFWNGGSDSGGECGMPTSRRFRVPETGNGVFWYSFEVGNVHVAMISSEHDPSPGSPLGDWLAADLLGAS